jgi:IMP dehydrogenase
MDTVTGSAMAKAMQLYGAQACLHRFCSIEDNVKMFIDSKTGGTGGWNAPFVSVGLGELELNRAAALREAGAITFIVDVAHGAQLSVVKQVKAMRNLMGGGVTIVVGNFATGDSVKEFLEHSGDIVDGIKVGIGPGSLCITRTQTGVGYPQLSAIIDIVIALKNTGIPVIADGGMKTPGDIAKALGAGASMVMLGGMLAGTEETPGELFYLDSMGKPVSPDRFLARRTNSDGSYSLIVDEYSESFPKVKKYRGSASKESYQLQSKNASWRTTEGESFFIPYKGPVKDVLQDIEGGIRSAMSYVGAKTLREFQARCEFVRVSSSTVVENGPHGKKH